MKEKHECLLYYSLTFQKMAQSLSDGWSIPADWSLQGSRTKSPGIYVVLVLYHCSLCNLFYPLCPCTVAQKCILPPREPRISQYATRSYARLIWSIFLRQLCEIDSRHLWQDTFLSDCTMILYLHALVQSCDTSPTLHPSICICQKPPPLRGVTHSWQTSSLSVCGMTFKEVGISSHPAPSF